MKKTFLLILFLGLLSQIGYSQEFNKAKLDNFFTALKQNNKFMGSIAVSKNGKIIYTNSVCYADIKNKIKANKNTKYRIGSISKTFTAVLVLKAVDKGKLELDQTIDKFFPTIPNVKEITINQLLHHRSGIHNFTADKDYLTWNTEPKTEKQMVDIIAQGGSDFKPGSKFKYSNSNYVLLTYILEEVFHKSYAQLLQQYITQPLGLENTYLGNKINTDKNESQSYKFMGAWELQSETDISIPLGAGGIVSTPIDLIKFSNALFNGKLLKPENLTLMKKMVDGYGMGLIKIPFYSKVGYGHTGGIDGFSSVFAHFPDKNISYALTSNGTVYNINNISIAVLSAVYDKPYEIPEFSHYKLSSEELDKYLGIYASQQIPLKITITKENNTLIAQATGQPSFPLQPTGKNKFKFSRAGVVLVFNPKENTMILKQGGGEFKFTKE